MKGDLIQIYIMTSTAWPYGKAKESIEEVQKEAETNVLFANYPYSVKTYVIDESDLYNIQRSLKAAEYRARQAVANFKNAQKILDEYGSARFQVFNKSKALNIQGADLVKEYLKGEKLRRCAI